MKFFCLILMCHYISATCAKVNHVYADNLKLDLVQVLFRHGARTPIAMGNNLCKIADTSPYESYGFGELTKEGKDQEHKFGSFLRYRYNNFLGITYKPEDVYAYTSDMSRTKMSLEFLLAGLYPPVSPAVWNPHLKWSNIPYLYTPNNLDTFLGSYKNPNYLRLLLETLKSPEFTSKVSRYSDFFNFVKEKGMIVNCSSPLLTTGLIYDALVANEYMKIPLPEWYTPEVKEKLEEIVEFAWDTFIGTKDMKRLGAGSLIKTFIGNLNLNNKNVNPKKIYLYAGHDVNINLFTRAHVIEEFRAPPFGSALILEKLRDSNNQIYLRLLFWDGIDQLETLKLGNYTEFIPIEEYLNMIEPMLPSEKETNEMLDEILHSKSAIQMKSLFSSILKTLGM